MKILIIRPQPGADASAACAAAHGFEPVVRPFFAAEHYGPESFGSMAGYTALLITSANAVRYGGEILSKLHHLPVYAVGQKSADAARAAQMTVAATGNAGAGAITVLAARAGHRRLLWLTGRDHTHVTPPADVVIDAHIVYQMAPFPVPENFAQIVQDADCTALHSANAARHFAAACDDHRLARGAINIAVYSQNIAIAAGGGWRNIAAAACPNDDALFAAVRTTFTTGAADP